MQVAYSHASQDLHNFVREVGARVVIGEIKRFGDKYFNLATYIDKNRVENYVKSHVHWTENFVPGKKLKVIDAPFGKVGMSICFDAAFPEMMRVLALQGAVIIVNIAAVPISFPVRYVWRRLRAAALNNQVFVIYCNRPGQHFSGHSAAFDPRGEVLAHGGSDEESTDVELDLTEIEKWRAEERIYPHMRPLLYRRISQIPKSRAEGTHIEGLDPEDVLKALQNSET